MNGTIERTETLAAVVVEIEWTRPARKHHPEQTLRSRVGHVDAGCARVADGEIVARNVPLDSTAAGLPCDYCVPNLRGEVVVTAAERDYEANRPELPSGNGTGSRRAPVADEPSEAQVTFWKNLRTDYFLVQGHSPAEAAKLVVAEETRIRERGGWSRSFFAKNDTIGDAKNDLYVARKLAETRGSTAPTPAPAAPSDGIETNGRANRYGGACARCGSFVDEGAGLLGKRNGKWLAVHKPGECVEKGSVETPAPAAPLADVPEGHYAIRSTGSNDLSFYRIDRPADGPHAGKVYAKLIVGGHPDRNVAWKAIPGILARIADAGVVESATLYGREVGSCSRCNRHLTHAVSRFSGYGPKCREILGISVSKSQKQLAVEMALRLGWDVEIDGEERD